MRRIYTHLLDPREHPDRERMVAQCHDLPAIVEIAFEQGALAVYQSHDEEYRDAQWLAYQEKSK